MNNILYLLQINKVLLIFSFNNLLVVLENTFLFLNECMHTLESLALELLTH